MSTSNSARILNRRLGASIGDSKVLRIAPGPRKFIFWLSLVTVLLSFSVGVFCFQVARARQTTEPDPVGLATEDVPDQATVSLAQAIQALSIRH
jgi:hypothetical protein